MFATRMSLKVLLPYKVFLDIEDVTRVVVETTQGECGLLPNRLDCVASLTPGILTYETENGGEVFLAIDEGVMVKTGSIVLVSVRRALQGADLQKLRDDVETEFLELDEHEKKVRLVSARMEDDLVRRLVGLHHDG